MRGEDRQQSHLFSYLSPERRVPADHPLRAIRVMVDAALEQLGPRFAARPSPARGRAASPAPSPTPPFPLFPPRHDPAT